jgi:predicted restriction endonuclease
MGSNSYFEEIVFPPLFHQPIEENCVGASALFWFEYNGTSSARSNLMAQCPTCHHIFVFVYYVIADHAQTVLNSNLKGYNNYIKKHCPICHKQNSVDMQDLLIHPLWRS